MSGLNGSAPPCYGSSLGSNPDTLSKIQNGRHKQRSGQHTLARIATCRLLFILNWPAPIGRQPSIARDKGQERISYPVSRAHKCKFEVWFLWLDNEPISGAYFSTFLHILPLKQSNGWISMKSMKRQIMQKCLWITFFQIFNFIGSFVIYLSLS